MLAASASDFSRAPLAARHPQAGQYCTQDRTSPGGGGFFEVRAGSGCGGLSSNIPPFPLGVIAGGSAAR